MDLMSFNAFDASQRSEAVFLSRYLGKGVTKAVENVNKVIGPALVVRYHLCLQIDQIVASDPLQAPAPAHPDAERMCLKTQSVGMFQNQSKNCVHAYLWRLLK
jgi:hypothetical protein